METPVNQPLTVDCLPERLGVLFRSLRNGKHICRDDVLDFRELDRYEESLRTLFAALGYELVRHPGQGFFYFKGDSRAPTARMQAVTLFMLILFQDLEDKKFQTKDRAWERTLLGRTFHFNELPQFATAQRRGLMGKVGVTPETLHARVISPLARMGMLEMTGTDQFEFRSPIYRFVDLGINYANQELTAPVDGAVTDFPTPDGDSDESEGGRT